MSENLKLYFLLSSNSHAQTSSPARDTQKGPTPPSPENHFHRLSRVCSLSLSLSL